MNDPTKLVVNVQVTGDLEAAEERLREVWGGALCVSLAEHTEKELLRIQDAVLDLPGVLGGGASHGRVVTDLVYDDGSIQAWLDQEYGAGLVHLTSQLVDAG